MDNETMKEVLNELFSHLERLETQSEAILQFLKEKKRVTDKQLSPYLEQAANASNVKWRAARVRIDHLLSPEQPEKEAKLGTKPELHEDSSSAEKRNASDVKEEKRLESVDEESTRTGDQKKIESRDKDAKKSKPQNAGLGGVDLGKKEKPTPVEAVQARSIDGKKDQPEERSDSKPRNIEQAKQDQREQKSGSELLVEQQESEPAAQLKPEKTSSGKEAA